MKKILFFAVAIFAVAMVACGGDALEYANVLAGGGSSGDTTTGDTTTGDDDNTDSSGGDTSSSSFDLTDSCVCTVLDTDSTYALEASLKAEAADAYNDLGSCSDAQTLLRTSFPTTFGDVVCVSK